MCIRNYSVRDGYHGAAILTTDRNSKDSVRKFVGICRRIAIISGKATHCLIPALKPRSATRALVQPGTDGGVNIQHSAGKCSRALSHPSHHVYFLNCYHAIQNPLVGANQKLQIISRSIQGPSVD